MLDFELSIHVFAFLLHLDQNKDGQINRKDMTKIIEAMYDLANEEDRSGEKSPSQRVELIMQRLQKDKDGKSFYCKSNLYIYIYIYIYIHVFFI